MMVEAKSTFRERADKYGLTDAQVINSNNPNPDSPPKDVDVTVVGGGIHGLIYSIHARCFDPKENSKEKKFHRPLQINLFEKSTKPSHKIGESTLPPFSLWMKMLGFKGEILLRIFGMKDGLNFYTMDKEHQGEYSDFASNGPPGLFLAGFQVERSISELFLTLVAQRRGINVYHSHQIDVGKTQLSSKGNTIPVQNIEKGTTTTVECPLLIDGTGRFRRYSSKAARVHRFEGWNTDAYWAYFTCKDESKIPIRKFEGPNTNHLCFPEGWAWVIRLPSWQGSPIANLMDMMNFLIDHAEAGTPGDEIPSMYELAEMFGCKVQWVWSIGFAIRDDVPYPEKEVLEKFGSNEAERKFNWIVSKYVKLQQFIQNFELIHDLYGPGTTWTIRKSLTFASDIVSGDGWAAIGDSVGFTNPLHSPGISATMGSTGLAAELTHKSFMCKTNNERRHVWAQYDQYVIPMVRSLNMMNRFNYVCFRHPSIPPQVCFLWQYFAGVGNPGWQWIRHGYSLSWDNWTDFILNWLWGSRNPEYVAVARNTLRLLDGPYTDQAPSPEIIKSVIDYSNDVKREAVESNRFNFRWAGLLRFYNENLEYDIVKYEGKDRFARQCKSCQQWHALRADWTKCYNCGQQHQPEDREIEWDPPLIVEEVSALVMAADSKAIGRAMALINDINTAPTATIQIAT